MAQEKFEQLIGEWIELSDITTVDSSLTYYIQNRGPDVLVACEDSSKPDEDNRDGILVKPYKVLKYKVGADNLYLRAFANNCSINITSEG